MTQRTTRIPNPVYAVAGVGEIAYRQLRELREEIPTRVASIRSDIEGIPARVVRLGAELRDEIPARVGQIRNEVPTVDSLVAGAVQVYGTLIARGERIVGRRRTVTVATHTAPPPAKKATKATKATRATKATKATKSATAPATKSTAKATKATKKATATKRTAAK
jgi:hypothetical protein